MHFIAAVHTCVGLAMCAVTRNDRSHKMSACKVCPTDNIYECACSEQHTHTTANAVTLGLHRQHTTTRLRYHTTSFIGDAIKLGPEMKHKQRPSRNKNHSSNGWINTTDTEINT